jgi:NIMA (never in mitosis gene a)-related kinase
MYGLTDKERENAVNEVRILASLKNPNIIQYKEAFVEPQSQALW